MHTVTIKEAQAHLPELIAETQNGGEVVITQDDKPVAKLTVPPEAVVSTAGRWPAFGLFKGQIEIAPDFDEPLEDFKPYME